ncbi:MAG: LCP family protein [Clostridia bacterium]|nr:LCP family protein [Clostridia bacterium]
MSKTDNRKSTGKSVKGAQKKTTNRSNSTRGGSSKSKKNTEQEEIFQEVTINLSNTDYNENKKEKKQKKKKHKILKKVLCLVLIAFLIFAGIFVNNWRKNGFTLGGLVATILGHNPDTLAKLPRVNVLLIGQSENLTDTLMVFSYDPKTQDAAMLSIPRDTFIGSNKYRAGGMDKINALYQLKLDNDPDYGKKQLLKAVNNITDLDIQYYIKVDTKGLRELVDSVGGIYFDVPIDMDYDDPTQDLHIHLKKGYQLLDGDKAEQVVRFRHNNDYTSYSFEYGDNDIGRMKTQRAFITEVIKQLAKVENITKVDDYIKIANKHVETNLNLWSLKDYAPYAIDYKTENINSASLPGTPVQYNGLWFYAPNYKETSKIIKEMFKTGLSAEQEKNSQIKIIIENGSGDEEKLEKLRSVLKEEGYTIAKSYNGDQKQKTSIINLTKKDKAIANELKTAIGLGVIQTIDASNNDEEADFKVIIGTDY